jgi:Protein of unknown function (DUF3224)
MTTGATFQVTSWKEETVHEPPAASGSKITRAHVSQTYSGRITGEGVIEYVMYHRSDGTAAFVGIEWLVGSVDGRSGSAILRHSGVYNDGVAESRWHVVSDSGTDQLDGIRGTGSFTVGHDMQGSVLLDVFFD